MSMTGHPMMTANEFVPTPPGQMISLERASRWYKQVIGINDVSCQIATGVTALLGPNGRGQIHNAQTDYRAAQANNRPRPDFRDEAVRQSQRLQTPRLLP